MLGVHPDVDNIHHLSQPSGGKFGSLENLANSITVNSGEVPKIVVVLQDKTANNATTSHSSWQNMPISKRAKDNLVDDALNFIGRQLDSFPNQDIVFVSYESLLLHRDDTLYQTFVLLGMDPNKYDYNLRGVVSPKGADWSKVSLEGKDGNSKYYRTSKR